MRVFLIFAILFSLSVQAQERASYDFPKLKTSINYDKQKLELESITNNILTIGEVSDLINKYEKQFGEIESFKTTIYTLSEEDFQSKLNAPSWSKALYLNDNIYLQLNSHHQDAGHIKKTLKHELSHVILDKLGKGKVPAWLDEGMALIVECLNEDEIDTINYFLGEHLDKVTLSSLQHDLTNLSPEVAAAAYAKSLLATKTLLERFNDQQLKKFISQLNDNSQEQAFRNAFNQSLESFENSLNYQF